jgi:NMD protein affecting ribosome stability and mRNA decay
MKHPTILQIRGKTSRNVEEKIMKIVEKTCPKYEFERTEKGMDIYISDVNNARIAISKIKKIGKIEVKASTKYAGLRKGRVRTLFVYCLRLR